MEKRCDPDRATGDCLTCGAAIWNGEACRRPMSPQEGAERRGAYERGRAAYKRDHPDAPKPQD